MQTQNSHNVSWLVSLSNGETFLEGKGKFAEIPNEPSPWQKLIKYTAEKKVLITSLSLHTKDGRTFNLPSLGKNPKFKPFSEARKPLDYNLFRATSREMGAVKGRAENIKISEWYTVIEAIYPSYKLQLWVDEMDTRNSWVLLVENGK